MRYSPNQKEEQIERWYVLDTKVFFKLFKKLLVFSLIKEEIDQLLSALNPKGIKEKGLNDAIHFNLKHGFLNPIPEAEKLQPAENSSSFIKKTENSEKLSEILTNLINNQSPVNENKPERNTRGRPKKNSTISKKTPLSIDIIKDMIMKVEIYFNNYLLQRSSRWLIEEERLKYVKLKDIYK